MSFSPGQDIKCFALFSHVPFFDKMFFILSIKYTFPSWWPKHLWYHRHFIIQTTIIWSRSYPTLASLPMNSSGDRRAACPSSRHHLCSAHLITPHSDISRSAKSVHFGIRQTCIESWFHYLLAIWCWKVVHFTYFTDEKNKVW